MIFMGRNYKPSRITIIGVGVDHGLLEETAAEYDFGLYPPLQEIPSTDTTSSYIGGKIHAMEQETSTLENSYSVWEVLGSTPF